MSKRVKPVAMRAALLVVGVGALALVGCGNRADASSMPDHVPTRAPSAAPSPGPTRPAPPGGRVGAVDAGSPSLSELRLLDADAIQREMKAARGRPLFVHMWASWCGPCIEELPFVDRFAHAARARGAVVLSISLDTSYLAIGRVPVVLRARAPNLTPIVARFDNADRFISLFSKSWEGSIPAIFVFDRAGKLERSLIGGVGSDELDALVAALPPPLPVSPLSPGTTLPPGSR